MNLGGPELLIVLAVVMLLFGAKKVPDLARSLGQAKREFEDGTHESARPAERVPTSTERVPTPAGFVPADRVPAERPIV